MVVETFARAVKRMNRKMIKVVNDAKLFLTKRNRASKSCQYNRSDVFLARDYLHNDDYQQVCEWLNNAGNANNIVRLNMAGVTIKRQYSMAIAIRKCVHYDIRKNIVVMDGPLKTSAAVLQSFIRERSDEDV